MAEKVKTETVPKVLVYGSEQVGVELPSRSISNALINMDIEPFNTDKKFQEYDGVIVFQSTFEKIGLARDWSGDSDYEVKCYRDELVRRQTQSLRLLEGGGWICFLLHRAFIDRSRYGDFSDTDLSKLYLNFSSFYCKSFTTPLPITGFNRSEFHGFLGEYGAATTYFDNYNEWVEKNMKTICTANDRLTGFILANQSYFVPARLPKIAESEDYFVTLGKAIDSTAKKLKVDIPLWAEEYRFPIEQSLKDREAVIQQQLADVRTQLVNLKSFKGVLCFEGDSLVESVKAVLRNGLGLKLSDREDQHLEDAMILDNTGQDCILVEIKGLNENLKNPHVYQADSHRGRREKPHDFPSLLIVNTFIKSSNKIEDKLRDFNAEQIKLAVGKHVLAMRTIDLLNLMRLKEQGKLSGEKVADLFKREAGWLKVADDAYEIRKE